MNQIKPFAIRHTTILWLSMYVVLLTAPLSARMIKTTQFHTVEFNYFGFTLLLVWFAVIMSVHKGTFQVKFDRILYFCAAFLLLQILSLADAPSKFRGILFTGQYVPYFFMMYLAIVVIDDEAKLDSILRMLIYLTLFFSMFIVVLALKFNDRSTLDNFLVDNFYMETTKILTYMELVFPIIIHRLLNDRVRYLDLICFFVGCLALLLSGSRGNLVVLVIMFSLAFIMRKLSLRKFMIAIGTVITVIAILAASGYVRERASSLLALTSEKSFQDKITDFSRLYTAEAAMELMKSHPFNGVGAGNLSYFLEIFLKNNKIIPPQIIQYWENHGQVYITNTTPLKLGAEAGIGGCIFFFVFYFYIWWRTRRATLLASGNLKTTLSGMKIFIIAGFIHNFTEPAFTSYYSWFFYGVVIAACRIAYQKKSDSLRYDRLSEVT